MSKQKASSNILRSIRNPTFYWIWTPHYSNDLIAFVIRRQIVTQWWYYHTTQLKCHIFRAEPEDSFQHKTSESEAWKCPRQFRGLIQHKRNTTIGENENETYPVLGENWFLDPTEEDDRGPSSAKAWLSSDHVSTAQESVRSKAGTTSVHITALPRIDMWYVYDIGTLL